MAETDAIFGGEHSGHFYFRDFWRATRACSRPSTRSARSPATRHPLGAPRRLRAVRRQREINSTVDDQAAAVAEVEDAFAHREGVTTDRLDGLTVSHPDWWFNVRPSNTEPLLRLNAEGRDQATMVQVRDAVLAIIRRDRP